MPQPFTDVGTCLAPTDAAACCEPVRSVQMKLCIDGEQRGAA